MISRLEEIRWDVDIEIFTVSRLEKNACIEAGHSSGLNGDDGRKLDGEELCWILFER